MPIRPHYRWLYPIDWRELSAAIRFRRAKGRCERCDRPHGCKVRHLGDGRWFDVDRGQWRDDRGRRVRGLPAPAMMATILPLQLAFLDPSEPVLPPLTSVVLASAHLNHDPGDNRPGNLAALCQRCHLTHDRQEHRRQRWWTLFRRRALGDLFFGNYGQH